MELLQPNVTTICIKHFTKYFTKLFLHIPTRLKINPADPDRYQIYSIQSCETVPRDATRLRLWPRRKDGNTWPKKTGDKIGPGTCNSSRVLSIVHHPAAAATIAREIRKNISGIYSRALRNVSGGSIEITSGAEFYGELAGSLESKVSAIVCRSFRSERKSNNDEDRPPRSLHPKL